MKSDGSETRREEERKQGESEGVEGQETERYGKKETETEGVTGWIHGGES